MSIEQALTQGSVSINGATLYYEDVGQGEPILFIHAGIADSRMWDDQFAALGDKYRVIRFDLRGFGRSNMPAGTFSNVEDVRALLDHVGVDHVNLVGISFGGLIATDFTLTYPERVTSLVLGAPSVSGSKPSDWVRQKWDEEDELIEQGDFDAATELNLQMWVDGPKRTPDQVDPQVRALVEEMQMNIFKIDCPDDDEIDELSLDPPAIGRLGDVKAPTLVMVGDLDLEEKLVMADQLVAEVPNSRKAIISGVAHMLNLENPTEFNRLLRDFLAENSKYEK